jgi:hypothetical protein
MPAQALFGISVGDLILTRRQGLRCRNNETAY